MNNFKRTSITFFIFLFFLLLSIFWWKLGTQPVNSHDKSEKMFIIRKASGMREIANNLKKDGLIRDPIVFFLLVKKLGLDSKIQAGNFRLSPSMSANDLARNLTVGTLDIWVTIPEGKRASEIAEILKEKMPQYDNSWPTALEQQEGYLFPDTYLIPKDYTIQNIITIFNDTFYKKLATINLEKTNPRLNEIVIIASLLEREAKTDNEKAIISGIIQNRLQAGIALQIDATIQYAKGKIGTNWWAPVTLTEYRSINSPYNTYLAPGLPPGPISNPGITSLSAAANPEKSNYVYYLHDRKGQIHYARTLDEHNVNIQKYGL